MTPLGHFSNPSARFRHVHLDIIGPLSPCGPYRYCLTAIDRFTRWPEVWPMSSISAEEVADTFIAGWVARFGVPAIVTTDQGRQFESHLFQRLMELCATKRCRTTSYHPCANGMIERVHRQLKVALMCHYDTWLRALPLVLLGMRSALKEDLKTSCAELVYGEPLRLPEEFLASSINNRVEDVAEFIGQLRGKLSQLRPVSASRHTQPRVFVSRDLPKATHIFLRDDTVRRPLTPPYSGPHKVICFKDKTVVVVVNGKQIEVSADRVKPAFLDDLPHTPYLQSPAAIAPAGPAVSSAPALPSTASDYVTRSGRRVRFRQPLIC